MTGLNKDNLFKARRNADDKWETANSVARSMVEAETEARRKKTERLRNLRLEAEGNSEAPSEPDNMDPQGPRRFPPQRGKRSLAIKDE